MWFPSYAWSLRWTEDIKTDKYQQIQKTLTVRHESLYVRATVVDLEHTGV